MVNCYSKEMLITIRFLRAEEFRSNCPEVSRVGKLDLTCKFFVRRLNILEMFALK